MRRSIIILIAALMLMALTMVCVRAQSIDGLHITPAPSSGEGSYPPGEGTSNSIFTVHFHWKDTANNLYPSAIYLQVVDPYGPPDENGYELSLQPVRGTPNSSSGALYEFRMTAGLDLVNQIREAPANKGGKQAYEHVIPELRDVYYVPGLRAKEENGEPNTITVRITCKYQAPAPPGGDPPDEQTIHATTSIIIHDSHPGLNGIYAGQWHDRDYIYAYYAYGDGTGGPQPIRTYGLNENFQWRDPDDAANPDDGTTATCYEFRCIYVNQDNLPPVPYRPSFSGAIGDHYIPRRPIEYEQDTGVVLYLKNKSWPELNPTEDFICVPMQKVDPNDNDYTDGVEYFYVIEPDWGRWNNDYIGLPIGEYEWFIACSDDIIREPNGDVPAWLDPTPGTRRSPFGTDPSGQDLPVLVRSNHPNWRSFMDAYNIRIDGDVRYGNLFLDRPTMQPGVSNSYLYPANAHPVISLGLRKPYSNLGTMVGTVYPRYTMVNPGTGWIQVGGAENQKWDFRIKYQHLYGRIPEAAEGAGGEISVWINDSDIRVPNPADPATQYRRYTLVPMDPLPPDTDPIARAQAIKEGIIYHLPNEIQLKPGPHSYFFTASDGLKRVRYPVHGHYYQSSNAHAFDGPYVNHKPVLSECRVDPPTGTSGDQFTYTVLYRDADNQRPYSAKIHIENADGQEFVGEMVKVNPADNDYAGAGVRYKFDAANLAQQFQEGWRRFYFEFTDDWGAPSDLRDNIRGETVYNGSVVSESWIAGPYINKNTPPQLLDGSVTATDGSNNSATLFEYKVRYVDADNHEPKYVDVFIGQEQDDGSIIWDDGHRMEQIDQNDHVYSGDGAWFRYYTKLNGSSKTGTNYYYCMVASDSIDLAEYHPTLSPSSGAVWWTRGASGKPEQPGERLTPTAPLVFTTTGKPIVDSVPNAPTDNPYPGPQFYDDAGNIMSHPADYSVNHLTGVVNTFLAHPVIYARYWFGTPGPLAVTLNTPPSLSGGTVTPDPGESTNTFRYRVTYRDNDGDRGQAPAYMRVRIDGVAYDMTSMASGEPNYKLGVQFYYDHSSLTPQLPHHYYFETSDGNGYARYDALGEWTSDMTPRAVSPILGPWVNNKPTLTAAAGGAVYPTSGANERDDIQLAVIYTDANNEPPTNGTPVAYVRKYVSGEIPPVPVPEPANDFKITAISGNTLTAVNLDDSAVNWTAEQFKGLPVQFTSGIASGDIRRIDNNTANQITLTVKNLADIGAAVGNTFSIGKIRLNRKPPDDNNYVDGVEYRHAFRLGEGEYAIHFKTETEETIGRIGGVDTKRTTILRYPMTGEITGVKVTKAAPDGNRGPVLTLGPNPFVSPDNGRSDSLFDFRVVYTDPDGDAPAFHDPVTGYIRLIVVDPDDPTITQTFAMNLEGLPSYGSGAEFKYVLTGSPFGKAGRHPFYFEASDGWFVTRYPAPGQPDLEFFINRPATIEGAAVTPEKGNAGMDYTFSVIYKDLDGRAPSSSGFVRAIINGGAPKAMSVDTTGGLNFVTGVRYTVTVPGSELIEGDPARNSFVIEANDGYELTNAQISVPDKPWVHDNHKPVLSGGKVTPNDAHCYPDIPYVYEVTYTDQDGDAPRADSIVVDVNINGAGASQTFVMTKKPDAENDFTAGVTYIYTKPVQDGEDGVLSLPVGNHTFSFRANDHELDADPFDGGGPNVLTRPEATLVVNPVATAKYDTPVLITGSITPAMAVPIELTYTKPDNATGSLGTVTSAANGQFSMQWTPDSIGEWTITATWHAIGSVDYRPTKSETTVQVSGPSTTFKGLDMISIPLNPANADPGAVFGVGSYALAQWQPWLTQDIKYVYYRSEQTGSSTQIMLGSGYWIKVNSPTLTVSPSGTLASKGSNYLIRLSPGWNMIGCPFNGSVNWGALRVRRIAGGSYETVDLATAASRGWIRSYGWAFQQSASNPFTGEYKLVDHTRNGALDKIEPWRGYWVKAIDANIWLVIPPPGTPSMEGNKSASTASADQSGWEVGLSASIGDLTDADNGLGVASIASRIESPTYLDSYVDLYFTDGKGGFYAYDKRAKASAGDSWTFRVATDQTDGLVEIAWKGIEDLPAGWTLTLTDEATGKSVMMTPGGVYTYPASEAVGGRSFRVTLGK